MSWAQPRLRDQEWWFANFSNQAPADLVVGIPDATTIWSTYSIFPDNCKFEHPANLAPGNRTQNQQTQPQNSRNSYGALGGHNVTPANNTGFGGNQRNQSGTPNSTGYRGNNQAYQGTQNNQRQPSGSTFNSIWAPPIIYPNLTWYAEGYQPQNNTRNTGSNRWAI